MRYKHCCGAGLAPSAGAPEVAPSSLVDDLPDLPALMQKALALQQAGKLAAAEAFYREALQQSPANFDALHMLGVVRLQLGDPQGGARHILEAIRTASVEYPPVYENLGLCLAAIARQCDTFKDLIDPDLPASEHPRVHFASDIVDFGGELPLVSVVLRRGTGDRFVDDTLESICRQTYRNLELLVVGESPDVSSTAGIAAAVGHRPVPVRCVLPKNRGALPTLNECVRYAQGRYVAVIDPGDCYEPDRIELMTRMLSSSGSRWGFSGVCFTDDQGRRLRYGDNKYADVFMRRLDQLHEERSVTAALIHFDYALAIGNLLLEKRLWDDISGFREDCPDPAWDFCLRASLAAAPAILYEPKYTHRMRDVQNSVGTGLPTAVEVHRMQAAWRAEIRRSLKDQPDKARGIFAAQFVREWRLLERGRGQQIKPLKLLGMAEILLSSENSHA